MVEPLYKGTFREIFLKDYPHDLVEKLFLSQHISAEPTLLDQIWKVLWPLWNYAVVIEALNSPYPEEAM